MKLTDIMSYADLSTFPQVGLVIFLVVFATVAWRVLRPAAATREALERAARLPLDDTRPGGEER